MHKSIFVLGGTTGLGAAIARMARYEGMEATVAGRTANACALVAEGTAMPFTIDLAKRAIVIPKSLGPFDMIVWAAGMQQRGRFADLTGDDIRRHCRAQLENPTVVLAELLRRQLRAQRPVHLVVIGSTTAWRVRPHEALYGALKAAQAHLARGLGAGLAQDLPGTKVLLANPGGMATPFWNACGDDTSMFMDPAAVARIVWAEMRSQKDAFVEIQILRQPEGTPKLVYGACLPPM